SCVAMMKLRFESRCLMARKTPDCKLYSNFINYFEIMFCSFQIRNDLTEIIVMLLFFVFYGVFICVLYLTINVYYFPTLKIAALKFHFNEYMAGVVIVAIANSTPDVLVNFSPVRLDVPTMDVALSNVLTVVLLSGGAVCFIRPFKMNGSSVLRDLLFLIFVIEVARFFIVSSYPSRLIKGALMLSIYPVYLLVNIIDLLLLRHAIKKLRGEVDIIRRMPSTKVTDKHLVRKIRYLTKLEEDDDIALHDTKQKRKGSFDNGIFVTPKPLFHRQKVNVESNRTALHNKLNPQNLFLFTEFFHSLNPIDIEKWQLHGIFWRLIYVIRAPITVFLILFIPQVNFELVKHGWSKMLNCVHIVLNPFLIITFVHSMFHNHYNEWLLEMQFNYSRWSLVVTLPLAVIVFVHSRTDVPPPYHIMYSVLTLVTVLIFSWICAWEMEALVSIIGVVFELSANFMTISFSTLSEAAANIISYSHLAQQGYGKMAFGAIIGGGVFSFVGNIGVELMIGKKGQGPDEVSLISGDGETTYIFLMIAIGCTLWWCLTFDFNARRSAGIFMLCLFVLFYVYILLEEFRVIHEFVPDFVIPMEG
ncbi:hypothetical protein KR009_010445, partial [Drosophila setifemur]